MDPAISASSHVGDFIRCSRPISVFTLHGRKKFVCWGAHEMNLQPHISQSRCQLPMKARIPIAPNVHSIKNLEASYANSVVSKGQNKLEWPPHVKCRGHQDYAPNGEKYLGRRVTQHGLDLQEFLKAEFSPLSAIT